MKIGAVFVGITNTARSDSPAYSLFGRSRLVRLRAASPKYLVLVFHVVKRKRAEVDDLLLILDDALPEETILLPHYLIRTETTSNLTVLASPDDAVYCSDDVYDSLTKWELLLN